MEEFRLAVVTAGTSDPSSTRLLADRTAERIKALAQRQGHSATISVINLREFATDISTASSVASMRLPRASHNGIASSEHFLHSAS